MFVQRLSAKGFRAFRDEPEVFAAPRPRPDGSRLTVLAGPNGSGKTAALEAIALVASRLQDVSFSAQPGWRRADGEEYEVRVTFAFDEEEPLPQEVHRPWELSLRSKDGLPGPLDWPSSGSAASGHLLKYMRGRAGAAAQVLYFSTWRRFARSDVAQIGQNPLFPGQQRQYALAAGEAGFAAMKAGIVTSAVDATLGQYQGPAADALRAHAEGTLNAVRETLREAFGLEYRRVARGTRGYEVLVRTLDAPGAGEFDIDELSSGQKEVLAFLTYLRTQAPRHSIVLIDEPELHLHVSLQRWFVEALLRTSHCNHVVLATHSPTIVEMALDGELVVLGAREKMAAWGS